MDWNITDSHILEFTAFSDKQKNEQSVYANTEGVVDRLNLVGTNFQDQGGENYVLKYTGYLTDTFTLSALIGHGEFTRAQHLVTASGLPVQYNGDINSHRDGLPADRRCAPAVSPRRHRRVFEHLQHHQRHDRPHRLGRHARPVPPRRRMATRRPPAALRLRPGRL